MCVTGCSYNGWRDKMFKLVFAQRSCSLHVDKTVGHCAEGGLYLVWFKIHIFSANTLHESV